MRSSFDDFTCFEDENLIGALDRRQAMGDYEGRPALAQSFEAVLNHGFALAVEARRGFIENQNLRICQNRARYCDALALTAGEPDAALADDGVVAFFEGLDKLVAMGNATDGDDLFAGCVRTGIG